VPEPDEGTGFWGRQTGFQGKSAVGKAGASGLAVAPKVASAPRGTWPFRPCVLASSIPAAPNLHRQKPLNWNSKSSQRQLKPTRTSKGPGLNVCKSSGLQGGATGLQGRAGGNNVIDHGNADVGVEQNARLTRKGMCDIVAAGVSGIFCLTFAVFVSF